MAKKLGADFFRQKASIVAPRLIGKRLCTKGCSAIITEAEAYEGSNDPASHAFRLTERSRLMHETFARWYVYFIYGNHHCLNITCGKGAAGAVLIREAVPEKGAALMRKRRSKGRRAQEKKKLAEKDLCSGPGKLCSAFGIDKSFNGLALGKKLWLEEGRKAKPPRITKLPRIGITKAKSLKWRFRAESG